MSKKSITVLMVCFCGVIVLLSGIIIGVLVSGQDTVEDANNQQAQLKTEETVPDKDVDVIKETKIEETAETTKLQQSENNSTIEEITLEEALSFAYNAIVMKYSQGYNIDEGMYESENKTHYLISVGVSEKNGSGALEFLKVSKTTGEVEYIVGLQNGWTYFEEYFSDFMDTELNDYQLKQYVSRFLKTIYNSDDVAKQAYSGSKLKYLLADLSGDGKKELVACGIADGLIFYTEVYTNRSGSVELVMSDHAGYSGYDMRPAYYNGRYYLSKEYYGSGTGCLSKLYTCDVSEFEKYGEQIILSANTTTAQQEIYDPTYRWYVNGAETTEQEYMRVKEIIKNSVLTADDLKTLEQL